MLFRLWDQPQVLILLCFALLFALTFHEFGHAYVAYLFGDNTAKLEGRLTLNPMAHLDLMGTLMILFIGIGYAKPVPVDPRNMKHPRADLFVSAAGPGMNLLLVLLAAGLFNFLVANDAMIIAGVPMYDLLITFMIINMALCLFNMIPLGPLDGSYVLPHFLPREKGYKYRMWNERNGSIALVLLMVVSFMDIGFNPFSWIFAASKSFISVLL